MARAGRLRGGGGGGARRAPLQQEHAAEALDDDGRVLGDAAAGSEQVRVELPRRRVPLEDATQPPRANAALVGDEHRCVRAPAEALVGELDPRVGLVALEVVVIEVVQRQPHLRARVPRDRHRRVDAVAEQRAAHRRERLLADARGRADRAADG